MSKICILPKDEVTSLNADLLMCGTKQDFTIENLSFSQESFCDISIGADPDGDFLMLNLSTMGTLGFKAMF